LLHNILKFTDPLLQQKLHQNFFTGPFLNLV